MKKLMMIMIAASVIASGCAKKGGAGVSPSPTATAAEEVTKAPGASEAPGTSPTNGSSNVGGGGAATSTPAGGAPTKTPENLPGITREQLDKLDLMSTYDDLVKVAGKQIKPIKEEAGKKTYELKLSNETNAYVELIYFSDGTMSEKRVFLK